MSLQIESIKSEPLQQDPGVAKPFTPSFLDRLMDFVQQLPIPFWLTYLVLFLLEGFLNQAIAWITGWLPRFQVNPLIFLFPLWLWGPLAIITHLDRVAMDALSSFSPLIDIDEKALKKLKFEFTTMPAIPVILSGIFWLIIYLIVTYLAYQVFYVGYGLGKLLSGVVFVEGLISYSTGSVIYYHSLRQLYLVNRTVKMVNQFDLFHLDPVYAFSRLTAQIGVAWMIMLSLTLLVFPIELASLPVLMVLVLQIFLAIAAFVLPLWFVHSRLVSGKRKLISEHNQRVKETLSNFHDMLEENRMAEADKHNFAINALVNERSLLTSIPTWPWRAGTLTGFLSAIGLPILLFILQLVIKKYLGG
jgi:hypothetical protein